MADFAWRAIDPAGRERTGRLAAANENDARSELERRRFYVVAIDDAGDAPPPVSLFGRKPRLSVRALALFTRQLATLVQVSPVEESLRTIGRQTEKPAARAVIMRVHQGVTEGQRLPDAMAQEPLSFDPLYCAVVAAGDSAGSLAPVLERLALLLERRAELRGRVFGALAYPAVLAVVASLVVVALMIFVVPKMVEQFDTVGQQLPLLTRIVMGISLFLKGWWWLLAIAIAVIAFLIWQALRTPAIRLRVDRRLLRLPLIGRVIRDLQAATLARNLATMVAARMPLVEGLALARDTVRNLAQRQAIDGIITSVRGGGSLSNAMAASALFPPLLVYLVASGESSGRLETLLERAADYLEREFDSTTRTALALLEPAVIVIMGVIVALIVLSVLLPILQLESLAAA
jgi:general secretion pathway protein F